MNKRILLSISTLLSALLLNSPALGYYETGESGEIQKLGTYRAGIMPQLRLSDGSGMNFTGFFDAALNEESSLRVLLGAGETDFYTGGSYKWIPIPDYDRQPALGLKAEALYARKGSDSAVSLRLHPLVSKKFEIEQGVITPYVSLPFGTTTYQSNTTTPVNIVTGLEFITPQVENTLFGVELGLNANKSFSYLSAFATIMFDEKSGLKKRK